MLGGTMKKNFVLFITIIITGLLFSLAAQESQENLKAQAQKLAQDSGKKFSLRHKFGIDFAYYPGTHGGLGAGGFAPVNYNRITYKDLQSRYPAVQKGRNDLGSQSAIELKAYYTFQIHIPAMQKNNMLMRDNHVNINVVANMSPVTAETGIYFELTPLAFLVFEFGSKVGTGWDFPLLGINGLAINQPSFAYSEKDKMQKGTAGVISISKAQATLQFDIAAVVPGDWNHFVFAIVQNVEYQYFSAAKNHQFWIWEADKGENQNGFVWYQTFLIGYQMPKVPVLDTIAFTIETEQRVTGKNTSKMKDGGWGSDFLQTRFGPLIKLDFNKHHSLIVLAQFITKPRFTEQSMGHRYFANRQINKNNTSFVQFDRIALAYRMSY